MAAKKKEETVTKKDKFFVGAYRDSTKQFRLGIPQKTDRRSQRLSRKLLRTSGNSQKFVEIEVDPIPEK
jgi:hypothetical protein